MAIAALRGSIPFPAVHRFIRIPLSGIAFLFFYGGLQVIAWILLPLERRRLRELPADEAQAQLDDFFVRAYRVSVDVMATLGLMRYELPSPEAIAALPPGPKVVVANHPSLIDVLFIKACMPGVVVLVKSALYRSGAMRRVFEASGDFKGPEAEEQRFGVTAVLDIFVDRLRSGRSVLVFPEGTRSPAWRLRRFRRGAAEAAVRAGVPIVPMFILSDPPVLKKGDKWYDMPERVPLFRVELLDVIETAGRDSRSITAEIRDLLAERLEAAREHARARHRREQGQDEAEPEPGSE